MNNLDYGVIGNCKSAALVSKEGAIEWCCLPSFNSPSVFASILDKKKGGSFEIIVDNTYTITQQYMPKTNILVTKFTSGEDSFHLIDFMPRYEIDPTERYAPPDLIRFFKYKSGAPRFKILYNPQLEYGNYETVSVVGNKFIKTYTKKGDYDSMYLYTSFDMKQVLEGRELTLDQDGFLLLSYNQKIFTQTTERSYLKLQRTKVYWLNWAERTKEFSHYHDQILRSALVLKLLSYDKTGAILAAATTSIPETIGGVRNWDYRFCWIRDSSMVIKVMAMLGHMNVANRYMRFIINVIPEKDEKMQIMYGIHGEKKLQESILDHLSGYQDSVPVRIGNDAYKQKQHDIYGILMDTIYQQFQIFEMTLDHSEELWTVIRSITRTVRNNWKKPDRGIWEIRSEHRQFTFSKVLCWVAVDRAIKIAEMIGADEYLPVWCDLRDEIREDIFKKAWNEELGAFTQYYGSDVIDASNLLMESYGFISAYDPKFISTVKVTEKHLCHDGLMYRYRNHDDFGQPASSFTICTFWLINSLYKIGETEKAQSMFARILSYGNHLGLFSEDIEFKTKRLLGNFPQAYSHLALIETAMIVSGGKTTREGRIRQALQ